MPSLSLSPSDLISKADAFGIASAEKAKLRMSAELISGLNGLQITLPEVCTDLLTS